MPEDASLELERRLATLEERTRPKPKTLVDAVKEWAGVGTLVVALLYTFPLGVWDRFILTPQQSKQKRVDELRTVLTQLMEKDAEYARSYSSIQSDQLRTFFSRAVSSAKVILISRNDVKFDSDVIAELSIGELIGLGYSISQIGNASLAEKIFDQGLQKARAQKAVWFEADLYRMKAGLYSPIGPSADAEKMRENFDNAVRVLLGTARSPAFMLQASNSAYEWAILELAYGDWSCGKILGDWALKTVKGLPPVSPEVASYTAQYERQLSQFINKRADQPAQGCPNNRAAWASL